MNRHRWCSPERPSAFETVRACKKCGVLRITRHDQLGRGFPWIEWVDADGVVIDTRLTPHRNGVSPAEPQGVAGL